MNVMNRLCTSVADFVLVAMSGWTSVWPLLFLSILAGIGMAIVFRWTSAQGALKQVADQSRAQVLAIKLFTDDLRTMFRSFWRLLGYATLRLWYGVPPVLVMIVPLALGMVQLARWYEFRPLCPGESAIVEVQLDDKSWSTHQELVLSGSEEIHLETKALRDERECSLYWRFHVDEPGLATLQWQQGQESFTKHVNVVPEKDQLGATDYRRPGAVWWDQVLHPGEPGFSRNSPLQAIVVHYPRRQTTVLGVAVPWWATFFIVSMVAAMLSRPLVKVQF